METVALPKYNLNEEQEKKLILREYRSLLRSLKSRIKPGDRKLIRHAFEMAADAHKTMRRKSGEPYVLHPLAVAKICVEEIGLGIRSTICSLLHDTVEDTDISLDDIQKEFGSEIAKIVGEIGIDAIDDRFVTVIAVLPEGHLAQEEIAKLVDAIGVRQGERVDHVADRLRHLLSAIE